MKVNLTDLNVIGSARGGKNGERLIYFVKRGDGVVVELDVTDDEI